MRLWGAGNESWLSGSSSWGSRMCVISDRYLILRVRACCTALLVFSFCNANSQSMSIDCFRALSVTTMTNADRTWASKAQLNIEQTTSRSVFSLRQFQVRSCSDIDKSKDVNFSWKAYVAYQLYNFDWKTENVLHGSSSWSLAHG